MAALAYRMPSDVESLATAWESYYELSYVDLDNPTLHHNHLYNSIVERSPCFNLCTSKLGIPLD